MDAIISLLTRWERRAKTVIGLLTRWGKRRGGHCRSVNKEGEMRGCHLFLPSINKIGDRSGWTLS